MVQPRNLIVVGENAHVQILERHQSLTSNSVFTNSVTEVFAEKRAYLDYYKIQNDNLEANLIDNTYVQQQQQSIVSVNTFSFGGNLTRNNLEFYQEGEHKVKLTVKSNNGCVNTVEKRFFAEENYNLKAPTSFVPTDSDPRNNIFMPPSLKERGDAFHMVIIDPTGNMVPFTTFFPL